MLSAGLSVVSTLSSVDDRGVVSRRNKLGKFGMIDDEDPSLRALIEILRASLWKFWVEMPLRLGSESTSGVPERGDDCTLASNVTPGLMG